MQSTAKVAAIWGGFKTFQSLSTTFSTPIPAMFQGTIYELSDVTTNMHNPVSNPAIR